MWFSVFAVEYLTLLHNIQSVASALPKAWEGEEKNGISAFLRRWLNVQKP